MKITGIALLLLAGSSIMAGSQEGSGEPEWSWLARNYPEVLKEVMPFPGTDERFEFANETEWIAVMRIVDPLGRDPEVKVEITKDFDGAARASVLLAEGDSIRSQLWSMRPAGRNLTAETAAKLIKLRQISVRSDLDPALSRHVHALESLRVPVLPDSDLVMDAVGYSFTFESRNGNVISIHLLDTGNKSDRLIRWAQNLRTWAVKLGDSGRSRSGVQDKGKQ